MTHAIGALRNYRWHRVDQQHHFRVYTKLLRSAVIWSTSKWHFRYDMIIAKHVYWLARLPSFKRPLSSVDVSVCRQRWC